jgi:HlyD family secretion protein
VASVSSLWMPGQRGDFQVSCGVAIFFVLISGCLLTSSCSSKEKETTPTATVQVATAERKEIQHKIQTDAVLYPLSQSAMAPKINAPVAKYYVNRGSHVRAGQLLAVLENRDLLAAATENKGTYDQAQAAYEAATQATVPEQLEKAQSDLNAAKQALDTQQALYDNRLALYKQGAIAQKDVNDTAATLAQARATYGQAKRHLEAIQRVTNLTVVKSAAAQLESAKGKYEGAQAQVGLSELRSPITGVVTDRPLYPGEMPASGGPIITVMDISQVIAKAHISLQEAESIRVGDPATIKAAGIAEDVAGKVTVVSPALDPNATTVEVWVQVPNRSEQLKPGTSARVTIVARTVKDAVVIPASALLTAPDGRASVMVAHNDKPEQTPVKVGIRDGDNIQITDGLNGGEQVVTAGAFELSQEDPKVLKNTKLQIISPKEEEGGKE